MIPTVTEVDSFILVKQIQQEGHLKEHWPMWKVACTAAHFRQDWQRHKQCFSYSIQETMS